ncbi:hypothetical protein C2R22_09625 [Salinigranum rubrum]|uniref:Uncharacterized protein n=1 Tax=Salinigranum rubrum TaxID=755307 RepID=A0A2I8VIX0_9EURY|nr:hypothetical protein C2R22_09625 [Salinigranum rubrum]
MCEHVRTVGSEDIRSTTSPCSATDRSRKPNGSRANATVFPRSGRPAGDGGRSVMAWYLAVRSP